MINKPSFFSSALSVSHTRAAPIPACSACVHRLVPEMALALLNCGAGSRKASAIG